MRSASGFPVWSSHNYTISLQTTSEPYGLTIHFDSVTAHVLGVERDIDKRMYAIAPSCWR
ncbi:MAG: DUF4825 domain-containing protein [Dysosmobacter welbionis]